MFFPARRNVPALSIRFAPPVAFAQWSWAGSTPWAPPSRAINSDRVSGSHVPMGARVAENPAQITWQFLGAGNHRIYGQDPDALAWGPHIAEITAGASLPGLWADTNLEFGVPYEYGVRPTNATMPRRRGNLMAGIRVDRSQPRALAPDSGVDLDPTSESRPMQVLATTPSPGIETITIRAATSVEDAPGGRRLLCVRAAQP